MYGSVPVGILKLGQNQKPLSPGTTALKADVLIVGKAVNKKNSIVSVDLKFKSSTQ